MRLSINTIAVLMPMIALAMRLTSTGTANYSYLVIAGYALLGRGQAIQALALSWLFIMLSEGIAPVADMASVGRYAVIAGAAFSVFLRSGLVRNGLAINRTVFATLALGVFLVFHSMLFSFMPDVSILKAVSWTVVMMTLLSAWSGLTYEERVQLERQVFGGLALLTIVSVPLAFNAIGYLRNGTGFQGVLNHPQAFGPTVALLSGWLAGRLLGSARPRWLDMALLGLCLVTVMMSEARTAGLALLLGVASAVLLEPLILGIRRRRLMPGLASSRLHALVLVTLGGLMVAGPILADRMDTYLQKRSGEGGFLEAADASRGNLARKMIANISEQPWTGIGFGIASDPSSMVVERNSALGLPTGAVIEKGVLPLAVLEELGLVGLLIVATWLWILVRRGARSGIAPFAVLAILLFTNLGEATLFSPGGMGLLLLILLAWAVTGKRPPVQNHSCG